MLKERKVLYNQAESARHLYNIGLISREEAREEIKPYLEVFNKTSKEIAKKYDQRPKILSFESFIR